jgi:glutathione-regulated potassium-efflux system ancillary protein KefG
MQPVLVLFAHPALEKSRVNVRLVREARDIPGVTFHDVYEAYPDFLIDVRREQKLLLEHQVVVFQHPFYWYSAPAILKEWQDLVLEYGWAYGRGGDRLKGKVFLNAVTTGGPQEAYGPEGYNRFTMRQLLSPFDQTARLCGMEYYAPFVVHRSLVVSDPEEAGPHALQYRALLEALRDGALDPRAAASAERINDLLPAFASPLHPNLEARR